MVGMENKKSHAVRSREIFVKFLETRPTDYVIQDDRIEFEKGALFTVIFYDNMVILCDEDENTLRQGSVFDIIDYCLKVLRVHVGPEK